MDSKAERDLGSIERRVMGRFDFIDIESDKNGIVKKGEDKV